jgi:hypothetical protein
MGLLDEVETTNVWRMRHGSGARRPGARCAFLARTSLPGVTEVSRSLSQLSHALFLSRHPTDHFSLLRSPFECKTQYRMALAGASAQFLLTRNYIVGHSKGFGSNGLASEDKRRLKHVLRFQIDAWLEETPMAHTAEKLAVEEQAIRERMEKLQAELGALQDRMDEIARDKEKQPRVRGLRTDIRISAAPELAEQERIQAKVVPDISPAGPINPLEWLRQSPRGSGLFAPDPAGDEHGVALLFRTESGHITALGDDPGIEFRAAVFRLWTSNAVLVPVVVRVGPDEPENLFEAWANEYGSGLNSLMEALARQERIALCFYDDDGRVEQIFRVPNQLQAFAKELLRMGAGAGSMSVDTFHQARQAIYKQYTTLRSLWRALQA